MFESLEKQLTLAREWNAKYDLGFSDEDFPDITGVATPIIGRKDKMVAQVLVMELGDPKETIRAAGRVADDVLPEAGFMWKRYFVPASSDRIRAFGKVPERGISVQSIKFDAQWGKNFLEVRDPNNAPGAALLWAPCFFPRWLTAIFDTNAPSINIPGYEVRFEGLDEDLVLLLGFYENGECILGAEAMAQNEGMELFATPRFVA